MQPTRALFATAFLLIFVMTTVASAQNLLVNPDFDTDLSGWDGPAVWDSSDAFGSPSSGSATWVNDYAAGGSTIVRQCVELSPWLEGFDAAAYVFIPSGQPGAGYTYLSIAFYSDTDCSSYLSALTSDYIDEFDTWTPVSVTNWTPTGAAGARIAIANQKTASGDFQTYGDAITFAPNPEMIFGDGFESIDLSEWDAWAGNLWEGAYDNCSVNPCETGMDCLAIAGVVHDPTCMPVCVFGVDCPGREGLVGACSLSPTSRPPTHCALLCDPMTPVCPSGMECFDVLGGALCLWPE